MPRARRRWKVAAIQMNSTADRERNLGQAGRLVRRAAAEGAALVALPENFSYLHSEGTVVPYPETLTGELVGWLTGLSREFGCHILAGSIPERIRGSSRIYNTSVLVSPEGKRVAVYRKIHLFDVKIRGKVNLQESLTVVAGTKPVVAKTPLGNLGLTICYDLRFPELYRLLVRMGAQVLFVPAAFTAYTGPFHWLPLLRARAIENLCWVVAPAQVGQHSEARHSHGHTVVIDPWGEVVGVHRRGTGIVMAEIDLDRVDRVRRGLPSLSHARPDLFDPPRSRRR